MFHSARIKLTAWYLLIILLISISFSAAIYRLISAEIERFERTSRIRIERRIREDFAPLWDSRIPPDFPVTNPELLIETEHRVLFMLIIINCAIGIAAGGLGYILAGITLRPIKSMIDEQNRFISDASHELRTPLTSLKSAFEVYLRGKVDKLQSLSESLLEIAQYQKPDRHIVFEQLSVTEIIEGAIRRVSTVAKQKQITITSKTENISAKGNKYGLTDLFVILLDNAIKYSNKKSAVSISSHKTDGYYEVSVADHGIGISKKDLPHVFDRFFRADSARSKTGTTGYGLGLSIAKQITETHKGSIQIVSTPGQGSVCTVRLPVSFS
jgi:two-component system sensor histidine kinase CiaH